jgi:hypothetical protein
MTPMIRRRLSLIPTALRTRSELALENIALRQQLAVLNQKGRRPKLRKLDRFFWVLLWRPGSTGKERLSSSNLKQSFDGTEGVSPPTGLAYPAITLQGDQERTTRSGS